MKKLTVLLLLFTFITGFAADIVKDGKPAGVIVLAEKATRSARFAAAELNAHIEKITGTALPVVMAPQTGKTNIYVGASQYTPANKAFAVEEYMIKVKGNDIYLLGCDENDFGAFDYQKANTFPDIWKNHGTCYAVYDFLDRLGVRWYLPTELGTHVVKQKTLTVKDMEIRRKPTLEYRRPLFYNLRQDLMAETVSGPKQKLMGPRDYKLFHLRWGIGGRPLHINHSLYSFYKRFPHKKDWFAKGYTGKAPQMCLTNDEFVQQVIQDARDYFDGKAHPSVAGLATKGLDLFPVFPMDNGSWCKCEKCQKWLLPIATKGAGKFSNNKASNYIFQFVNRVAKEVKKTHPDKIIGCGAYHDFCYPPDFKLEDNIRVILCLHARGVYSPASMQNDRMFMDEWTKKQPQIKKHVWLYWCFPSLKGKQQDVRVFPGFFANKVDGLFREYLAANVQGTFMELSYAHHYTMFILMDQLELYVHMRLSMNKDLKGEDIINEFFKNYYGPAEKPMKAMYMLMQERFTNPKYRTKESSIEGVSWGQVATKDVMKQIDVYLAQAKKLATTEPYKARVALFGKGIVEYMQKGFKTYQNRALQMSGSMMQADVPYLHVSKPGDPTSVNWNKAGFLKLFGGLKAEPLKEKLEVRVAHDGTYLYLSYLNKTDTSKLITTMPLWQNDNWESYFAKQQAKPYYMFGVDSIGGVSGSKWLETLTGPWNEPGKIVQIKKKDSWNVLMALKLSEIVPDGIKPGEILYYNVLRTNNNKAFGCWIPTFAGFHAPDRFGELYLMPEKKK